VKLELLAIDERRVDTEIVHRVTLVNRAGTVRSTPSAAARSSFCFRIHAVHFMCVDSRSLHAQRSCCQGTPSQSAAETPWRSPKGTP
jgi:hypothetical protein